MSSRLDTPYLDASPSHYKKAEDNLYFTCDSFGDNRGIPRPYPLRSRPSHDTRPSGFGYNDSERDSDIWVDSRIFQTDYRDESNSQSNQRNNSRANRTRQSNRSNSSRTSQSNRNNAGRNDQSNQRNDSRTNQSNQRNDSRTNQSNQRNDSRISRNDSRNSQSNLRNPSGLNQSVVSNNRRAVSARNENNSTSDVHTTRTVGESFHNVPWPTSKARTRSLSESVRPHARPRPRDARSLPHQSHSLGDNDGPVIIKQPLPKPRLRTPVGRENLATPSGDNLATPSGDNLSTPSGDNLSTPSGDNLPSTSGENAVNTSRENRQPDAVSTRSNKGNPAEEIDSTVNRTKHRSVKPPIIRIDHQHAIEEIDDSKPPVSPRIRQLRQEAGTRNPMLGDCPRPHSLDTETSKKSTLKRTISAPELRHMNSEELVCSERTRTCVNNNQELRVEHQSRTCSRNSRKPKEKRSKSLPAVSVPRRSRRHHKADADPLRYFAYLGKKFQFRERLPSTHNVFSAGPVILTSTSVISPQVSNNFRNQYQEIDHDDVNLTKYQGACQDLIDCCTCMCCVKALFYHCTKDDDNEGEVSEHPCSCAKAEPYCMMRWSILGMLTVCMPCLLLYLPIQGCKRAVEYFRRKGNDDFETL